MIVRHVTPPELAAMLVSRGTLRPAASIYMDCLNV